MNYFIGNERANYIEALSIILLLVCSPSVRNLLFLEQIFKVAERRERVSEWSPSVAVATFRQTGVLLGGLVCNGGSYC